MKFLTARLPRPNLRGKLSKLSVAMQFLILITLLGTVGVGIAYATSLTLSDGEWVGLGSSAGRLEVDDQTIDVLSIEDADFRVNGGDILVSDSAWLGLSGSAGRIIIDDVANRDAIRIDDASLEIASDGDIIFTGGGGNVCLNSSPNSFCDSNEPRLFLQDCCAQSVMKFQGASDGYAFEDGAVTMDSTLHADGAASFGSTLAVTGDVDLSADLNFDRSTLTIASGEVTATKGYHIIDTESAASTDDLDTINGGVLGDILILTNANSSRDVTYTDGAGNLQLAGGDFAADSAADTLVLLFNGSQWVELSRSNN